MVRRRDAPQTRSWFVPGSGTAARHSASSTLEPQGTGRSAGQARWLKIVTGVMSVLLVGGVAFAAFWVIRLQPNISKAPLGAGSRRKQDAVND